jgi:hypothetical protein
MSPESSRSKVLLGYVKQHNLAESAQPKSQRVCTIRSMASHVMMDDSQMIDVRMYMGDDLYMYG